MAGSTIALFDAFMKDNFTDDEVAKTVNEDHFILDDLDTKRRGTGRRMIVPLIDGNPQGHAARVVDAQLAAAGVQPGANLLGAAWTIAWGDYSDHVDIGDKVIDASASDLGAFFEDQEEEIRGLYRGFGDIMDGYILRDSGHSLAQVTATGTTLASGILQLANTADIVNFERGQILVQSAGDGQTSTDTLLGPGTLGFVFKVDYNVGFIVIATTAALAAAGTGGQPTNWTNTGFLFRNSDFGASAYAGAGSASAFQRILLGFGAWNPATTAALTGTFEGVDRTLNSIRRSGTRLVAADVLGLGIEQRAKKLVVRMSSRAKSPERLLLHPEQWQVLADSLETKGVRNISGSEKVGYFNYESIKLATPKGLIPVFADKFMPIDAMYAYRKNAIRFATLSGFPKVVKGDGLQMLRLANENTYEYRLVSYPAYWHRDPSATGRAPLLIPS